MGNFVAAGQRRKAGTGGVNDHAVFALAACVILRVRHPR